MEMPLKVRVADVGKVAAAKEMGLTRQRVQMMCSRDENVWLRIKGGSVIGWYIYRSVSKRASSDEGGKDSVNGSNGDGAGVRAQPV